MDKVTISLHLTRETARHITEALAECPAERERHEDLQDIFLRLCEFLDVQPWSV